MKYTKIDSTKGTLTHETIVFKYDLESEKETIEKRLVEVNAMIAQLK